MEATAEGLAKAAATREALKAKKRELEKVRMCALRCVLWLSRVR